jgi:hypothetical protein
MDFAYRIISKMLNLVPTDMQIANLTFKLDDNGKKATIGIKELTLFDQQLETSINVKPIHFPKDGKLKDLIHAIIRLIFGFTIEILGQ